MGGFLWSVYALAGSRGALAIKINPTPRKERAGRRRDLGGRLRRLCLLGDEVVRGREGVVAVAG